MSSCNAPADVGVGPLTASFSEVVKIKEGQTCSGKKCSAEAHVFNVEIPDGGNLLLAYVA